MKHRILSLSVCAVVAVFAPAICKADVKLNSVFADHMVLQREAKLPIWGTAEAGEVVMVTAGTQSATATAGADGTWRVTLDALRVGGPIELLVQGKNKITVKDVLVGDVWLCSGQSNMAYPMDALKTTQYADDLKTADFPKIRHGAVARNASLETVDNAPVNWKVCTPENVSTFTAAGFYFARAVQKEIDVPIGLLHSSWGGTSVESWTSMQALSTDTDFKQRALGQIENLKKQPDLIAAFPAAIAAWEEKFVRTDTENVGEKQGWAAVDANTSDWKTIQLRSKLKDAGLPNGGIVWLRKEIDIPTEAAGRSFRLDWGSVEEMYETTYFNGEKLGSSGRESPQYYTRYIGYKVPENLVKAGKNVIAIRLVANVGDRTALGRQATGIGLKALGITKISDDVQFKIEKSFAPLDKAALAARPVGPKGNAQNVSATLFNGMINPIVGFPIKGAVWYQGEQDASRGFAYRRLLPLMIHDWRERWGQGDFPFYIQQLPNWKADGADKTGWAELREAQWLTAKSVPNTFIVCGLGLGESDDVHPQNKRDLGGRIALSILANAYGKSVVSSGPRMTDMKIDGSTAVVTFSDAAGLKTTDNASVGGFTIAGEDKQFVPADAVIDGETIKVSSVKVPHPAAVRYAFRNDPIDANLCNAAGLPTFPFRSDDWPGQTDKNK